MPDKFKDTFNLPVAIPAWGLISALVIGIFTAGMTMQKLDTLLENSGKTESRINTLQERQFNALTSIANQQTQLNGHENRITNIERSLTDKK